MRRIDAPTAALVATVAGLRVAVVAAFTPPGVDDAVATARRGRDEAARPGTRAMAAIKAL